MKGLCVAIWSAFNSKRCHFSEAIFSPLMLRIVCLGTDCIKMVKNLLSNTLLAKKKTLDLFLLNFKECLAMGNSKM